MVYPNAVILLGARAWISLIGAVMIVVGSWRADRIWDETVDVDEPIVTDVATAASEILESAYEYMDSAYRAVTNPSGADFKRVNNLFAGPAGFSLSIAGAGWLLFAISFLLDCHQFSGWNVSLISFLAFLVVILIAVVQTVILPLAIHDRSVHEHSHFFTTTLFCSYALLGVLMMLDRNDAPYWLSLVGAGAIAVAPNLLWFCRKRGDTYDRAAVMNPRPVLYNIGGPLLVAGWFMFWVAMNCMEGNPDNRNLPVYWTSRTAVAYEGALAILAAYWATGYAQDEHDDPDQAAAVMDGRTIRPLKAFVFGRVFEIRLAFVVAWCMIAVTAFLPFWAAGGHFSSILLFLAMASQGFASGVQHVLGVRGGDSQKLQKWTRVSAGLHLAIAFLVFVSIEFMAGMLVLAGSFAMEAGWTLMQKDRKRGHYWMETGQSNPTWTVYSYGVLLFPLGLLLFAWGLSIP